MNFCDDVGVEGCGTVGQPQLENLGYPDLACVLFPQHRLGFDDDRVDCFWLLRSQASLFGSLTAGYCFLRLIVAVAMSVVVSVDSVAHAERRNK